MCRLFIVFRTYDRIWTCKSYTKELAPFEMDMTKGPVKLMFMVDQIMKGTNDSNLFVLNSHSLKGNSLPLHEVISMYCNSHDRFIPKIIHPCKEMPLVISPTNGAKQGLMRKFSVPSLEVDFNVMALESQSAEVKNMIFFVLPTFRCTVLLDAHVASSINTECSRSRVFRRHFWKYLQRRGGFRNCILDYETWTEEEREAWENYLTIPYMIDLVTVWPKQKIDYAWASRILGLLNKSVVLEEGFAWLSTLGGAHSSLGEIFRYHAERAGEISAQQLRLAVELGNESLIARCYIFWSWSLLQQGKLRKCKACVLNTWKFCQGIRGRDLILENMCKAVWSRLRYKRTLLKVGRHRHCHKDNNKHLDGDDGNDYSGGIGHRSARILPKTSGDENCSTGSSKSCPCLSGCYSEGSAPSMAVNTVRVC